jgi:DNA polymerase III alpha subunit
VEAYQSAWLKLHYPAEFMAAVLTNGKGFYSPLVYVLECHRLGISLLPPSVNDPGPQFSVVVSPKGEHAVNAPLQLHAQHTPLQRRLNETPHTTACIRIPVLNIKGLTQRTKDTILTERHRHEFTSLHDFFTRVQPLNEEMERLIQAGAFDIFGKPRTTQYWEFRALARAGASVQCSAFSVQSSGPVAQSAHRQPSEQPRTADFPVRSNSRTADDSRLVQSEQDAGNCCGLESPRSEAQQPPVHRTSSIQHPVSAATPHSAFRTPHSNAARQLWLLPPENLELERRLPSVPLDQPERLQCLRWEEELLGYPVSGHPLELYPDIAWETYCPVNRLGEHIGEQIVTCGLVIEQRLFHQVTGEPMKFITIADWTGIVETELFARTYKSYGLATVRYPVLEITATVEPFENGRGFTLRVLRAAKPRTM